MRLFFFIYILISLDVILFRFWYSKLIGGGNMAGPERGERRRVEVDGDIYLHCVGASACKAFCHPGVFFFSGACD